MSGVVKAVGKTFKKVTKGVTEFVKDNWKPIVAVAAAYFVVGLAAGKFGGPEVLQKLPGFGETGIFTKLSSLLGFDFYGDGAAKAVASAAATPGADALAQAAPAKQGLLQQGAMLTPTGVETLGAGAETLPPVPTAPPVADLGGGGDGSSSIMRQFGPYYLAGQLMGGYGQAKMQEAQMGEGQRQFDATLGQRQHEFETGRMHPGAYGGMMADGSGAPIQLTPPQAPQVAPPQVAPPPAPQVAAAQPLSLDDLLRLQERGVVR